MVRDELQKLLQEHGMTEAYTLELLEETKLKQLIKISFIEFSFKFIFTLLLFKYFTFVSPLIGLIIIHMIYAIYDISFFPISVGEATNLMAIDTQKFMVSIFGRYIFAEKIGTIDN